MTTYTYLRVSTDGQDVENQLTGITAYAERNGLVVDHTVKDSASGKTQWEKRRLGNIIQAAEKGDILLVAEFSRLARSMLQILEIMKKASEKGIVIHVTKSNLIMDDSISSKIMAAMYGIAAEIERDLIKQRTKESLLRRKNNGLPMGRPPGEQEKLKLDEIAQKIDSWREKKISFSNIAKLADCSRSTLYAWIARRRKDWLLKEDA